MAAEQSGEGFCWDEEDTVIKPVLAVAVYLNPERDVVIRQQRGLGEDDATIVVPAAELWRLIDALQGIKEEG